MRAQRIFLVHYPKVPIILVLWVFIENFKYLFKLSSLVRSFAISPLIKSIENE